MLNTIKVLYGKSMNKKFCQHIEWEKNWTLVAMHASYCNLMTYHYYAVDEHLTYHYYTVDEHSTRNFAFVQTLHFHLLLLLMVLFYLFIQYYAVFTFNKYFQSLLITRQFPFRLTIFWPFFNFCCFPTSDMETPPPSEVTIST